MKYFFLGLLLSVGMHTFCQSKKLSREDQVIMYECKTIEDFMYRFNNDSMSSLNQSMSYNGIDKKLSRPESFKLCFKMDNFHNVETSVHKEFANYVLNNNVTLNFNDSLWYVRAMCVFDYMGRDVRIPLLMQLTKVSNMRRKWIIIDIGSSPILKNGANDTIVSVKRSLKRTIDANSYAMNFLELRTILTPTTKESSAFSPELLTQEKGIRFLNLIKSEQLRFDYASNMTFYFTQIPGYFFTVDQFTEDSLNSGWLINFLWKKTEEEKKNYLKSMFNVKK